MNQDVYQHPDAWAIVRLALHEDLRFAGDITCAATVPRGARLAATIRAKACGVVCGLPLFALVINELGGGVDISACAGDGTTVTPGDVVWQATGDAAILLMAERTGLNLAQRLSGTSTMTAHFVERLRGTRAQVLDTRKACPGLRLLQKHAVLAGGGANHRIGLYDQVLIKDNHIALMGAAGPAEAVRRARERLGPQVVVEVEIERVEDLPGVIAAGADIVLCDNLPPEALRAAVALRDATPAPDGRRVLLEASGGITLETARAYAESGVERLSTGAITHSVPALDLSMRCALA